MNQQFSNISDNKIDEIAKPHRQEVHSFSLRNEAELFVEMKEFLALGDADWDEIASDASAMIGKLRVQKKSPLIDRFLNEYSLSSDEGVRLMQLAEAMSRTSDSITADELIRDKIMGANWSSHFRKKSSFALTLSARALHLTDTWLQWANGRKSIPAKLITKSGNALLRITTRAGIRALSSQFVFAETLDGALKRARKYGRDGYLFSFDMLGEAARTRCDAQQYYDAYCQALDKVAASAKSGDPRHNHGISVKLSALHPRYEYGHADIVVPEITALLKPLCIRARAANVQVTIDAEEIERLDISMQVLAAMTSLPELHSWNGLGFVVQAYQRRALPLIDWLKQQSEKLGAGLMIRLVKGAYWDSEIKRAQEMGLESYPVFTRKELTDLSYLACAKKLLTHPNCFSPQFATHNAVTIAAVQKLAGADRIVEIQRLFGMGQPLHDMVLKQTHVTSRIYAPVGTQKDLLSYLIRRLLENGANSSFVNKLSATDVNVTDLTVHPAVALSRYELIENPTICKPRKFVKDDRQSAQGWDLSDPSIREQFKRGLTQAREHRYMAAAIVNGETFPGELQPVINPADFSETIGYCANADNLVADQAIAAAKEAFPKWAMRSHYDRATILEKAATLFEEQAGTFHNLAIKEAGKTWGDAIDEVREAIDFCRYYAARARDQKFQSRAPLGVTICISPWNFPLAIFTGQITAALAAGNSVVAKPAEQTPLMAAAAVKLLHQAGVDPGALNLTPGDGATIGEALVSHPDTAAICFTGSTATAKRIVSRLAELGRPLTPLIAETGGINAMIVDSSALLEQTVDAVISSAFQSAGQRCSALRLLCIQSDIADHFIALLKGAMETLRAGDPTLLSTDVGPVIDASARQSIEDHIGHLEKSFRRVGTATPKTDLPNGHFIQPTAFEIDDISDLKQEIFGPVLHVVRFEAAQKRALVQKINGSGYGLTLGIQSRIDTVCDDIADNADVGNIYINRNQIGAVVGVQPFGGQGLSGTGPKAGGRLYLYRLSKARPLKNQDSGESIRKHGTQPQRNPAGQTTNFDEALARSQKAFQNLNCLLTRSKSVGDLIQFNEPAIQRYWETQQSLSSEILTLREKLPSPAGETNEYRTRGRGVILSLLENPDDIFTTCLRSLATGNSFIQISAKPVFHQFSAIIKDTGKVIAAPDLVQYFMLAATDDISEFLRDAKFDAVVASPDQSDISAIGLAMANRSGPILPLIAPFDTADRYVDEKLVTNNVAAAGGDISLLTAA